MTKDIRVEVSEWVPGFSVIKMVEILRHADYGLNEAKQIAEDLVKNNKTFFYCETIITANFICQELKKIGVVNCEIKKHKIKWKDLSLEKKITFMGLFSIVFFYSVVMGIATIVTFFL